MRLMLNMTQSRRPTSPIGQNTDIAGVTLCDLSGRS